MSALALAVLACAAAVAVWPARVTPRDRARLVFSPRRTTDVAAGRPIRHGSAVLALLATIVAVPAGLPWWLPLGAAAAVVAVRARPAPAVAPAELPMFADLLAACLAAGSSLPAALDAAAVAGEDRLATLARTVAAALRQGKPAETAWAAWLADPALTALARPCVRAAGSGSAVAAELVRVAARLRARRRVEVQQRIARAGVWVVLPLGACFLPAFVLVGVVPVALGLLESL